MSESPAGWHPDPFHRYESRYWDGQRWTEHVASRGQQDVDAPVTTPGTVVQQHPAGWFPDPYGCWEHRYWDGSTWTIQMSTRGITAHDASIAQAPGQVSIQNPTQAATTAAPDNKVVRQAHSVGGDQSQVGGGTLFSEPLLVVNQRAKLFGSTLSYAVYDQHGHQLATVQELRRAAVVKAGDMLRKRTPETRGYRLQVLDARGGMIMAMTRPAKGWFSSKSQMTVEGLNGAPIGEIVQETIGIAGGAATVAHTALGMSGPLAHKAVGGVIGVVAAASLASAQGQIDRAIRGLDQVGHTRFGLQSGGQRLGSIHAESIENWDFRFQDPDGVEIARVTKTWAGWAKERFTKADNYVVQMHKPLDQPLRSLVVAAALALDIALKQGEQTHGSSVWGTRRYA